LDSHLRRILVHLLKIRYQPEKHTRSWDLSIAESRFRIGRLLRRSSSLRPALDEVIESAYTIARWRAERHTNMPAETFPEQCPFPIKEILG
jgi:hypothetical protein